MREWIHVDTGPLVAGLNRRYRFHTLAKPVSIWPRYARAMNNPFGVDVLAFALYGKMPSETLNEVCTCS